MNLVTVNTAVPGLSIPMSEIEHRLGNYYVAQYAASNGDWEIGARHIISQSGTGVAYAALLRNLHGDYAVRQLGSVSDVADLVGRDNMPKKWDGSTIKSGGVACFQWLEKMGFKGFDRPKQPVNPTWYQAKAFTLTVGGIYLLSGDEWTHAAEDLDPIVVDGQKRAHYSIGSREQATADVDDPRYKSNRNGLFQMIGNVWEWTDEIHDGIYKVVRGGSFIDNGPVSLRVGCRNYGDPGLRDFNFVGVFGVRFGRAVPRT